MTNMSETVYLVKKPFKYGGEMLEIGDEWTPSGGLHDATLVSSRKYVYEKPAEGDRQRKADVAQKRLNKIQGSKPRRIPDRFYKLLIDAGYADIDALADVPDEDLLAINGIGPGALKEIRKE